MVIGAMKRLKNKAKYRGLGEVVGDDGGVHNDARQRQRRQRSHLERVEPVAKKYRESNQVRPAKTRWTALVKRVVRGR